MNHKRDFDLAATLLGPRFEEYVRSLELRAEDPAERLADLVSVADRARSWCLVHRRVHEIRSPLNSLALTAQILAGELRGAGPTAPGLVATILREVSRIAAGLEELEETVQTEPERLERVDLAQLVRGLVEFASPALGASGMRLDLAPTALEVYVECDSAWTLHALLHVLMDAPTAAGSVTMQVTGVGKEGRLSIEHDGAPDHHRSRRCRFSEIAQPLIRAQRGRLERNVSAAGTRIELGLARWQPQS